MVYFGVLSFSGDVLCAYALLVLVITRCLVFEWFVLLMLCSRLDWPSYAGELWCSGFVCTVVCFVIVPLSNFC
jgi:hypothetical protein